MAGVKVTEGLILACTAPFLGGDRQVDEMSTMSGYPSLMIKASKSIYRGYRFPAEVIEHAVWLYFRFPLSLRMVEDLLAARGITVSHETVRCWAEKFGRIYADKIRPSASIRRQVASR
jgi:hypothetical protein